MNSPITQFIISIGLALPVYIGLLFVAGVFLVRQSNWRGAWLGSLGALVLAATLFLQQAFWAFAFQMLMDSELDPQTIQRTSAFLFSCIDLLGWIMIGISLIWMTERRPESYLPPR